MKSKKSNVMALIIGPPEHGKTSLAVSLARERAAAGRFVLAQDVANEMKHVGPSYRDVDELRAAIAELGEGESLPNWAGVCGTDGDELIAFSIALGELWNREHETPPFPITLLVNELTMVRGTGPTHLGDMMATLISMRRHIGIELIINLQWATQAMPQVVAMATDAFFLHHTRSDEIAVLERRFGVERGALAELKSYPPHRTRQWKQGRGLLAPGELAPIGNT